MTNFDKILNEVASKEMVNWNLQEFKKSHPHLYKVMNKVAAIYPFGNDWQQGNKNTLRNQTLSSRSCFIDYKI